MNAPDKSRQYADFEINQVVLDFHANPRPGKISVEPSKSTRSQRDLALAYTPGLAEPVRRIAADPDHAYKYTAKGNLVGVIEPDLTADEKGMFGEPAGAVRADIKLLSKP